MNYFTHFPKVQYTLDGKTYDVPDITIRHVIKKSILKDDDSVYNYSYKDYERPDTIATNYYGHPKYTWLVMMSANAFDNIHDFPMKQTIFEKYVENKYGKSIRELQQIVKFYQIDNLYNVDLEEYQNHVGIKRIISLYEYEYDINEKKRIIKLISKKHLLEIERELINNLRAIKFNTP